MQKSAIEFHQGKPAVNVKIGWLRDQAWDQLARKVAEDHAAPRPAEFTLAWIREALSQDAQDQYWQAAIDDAWEQLEEDVNHGWEAPIFGRKVKIYSQGRSGGWAVVEGFTREQVEGWDAIAVAKWAKFCRIARETADDVNYQYLSLIYLNQFCRDGEPREVKTWHAEGGDGA